MCHVTPHIAKEASWAPAREFRRRSEACASHTSIEMGTERHRLVLTHSLVMADDAVCMMDPSPRSPLVPLSPNLPQVRGQPPPWGRAERLGGVGDGEGGRRRSAATT